MEDAQVYLLELLKKFISKFDLSPYIQAFEAILLLLKLSLATR